MNSWEPEIEEILLAKVERTKLRDCNTVAVLRNGQIVGHVSYNLALRLSQFLKREVNKAFVRVTG